MRLPIQELREIVRVGLRCHLKIVMARQGWRYDSAKVVQDFKSLYKAQCASFEFDDSLEGTHHFHMHNPERLAPIINDFFGRLL